MLESLAGTVLFSNSLWCLIEVARAAGSYYKEIKEMNPHFSEETIPAGVHFLNLPPGTSEAFWVFFSDWEKGLECK